MFNFSKDSNFFSIPHSIRKNWEKTIEKEDTFLKKIKRELGKEENKEILKLVGRGKVLARFGSMPPSGIIEIHGSVSRQEMKNYGTIDQRLPTDLF